MDDHRTVASLIKDALDRYLANRRVRGEPPVGRGTGLWWIHVALALVVVAICLYFFFA